ncbi:ribosomal L1 domain-containing 1 [Pelobates cultripes]|uniref:Ribosomal L1 domain-containing protein 1 n=1 Tax=Pelobates cultripes TaxID=61616 RepID=A0AAD1WFA1_PELCU|nr:ribosomal L1 domain-containing 1 [Pelobates cultripes]
MAESGAVGLDSAQIKKAVQALLAYQKTKKSGNSLLLNEYDRISLMITVWRIPKREQTIKIGLPHGIRPEEVEVCLFTRDEPSMSSDQTEKFYKKLLSQHGIKHITEVIPLQKLKKEYKPFEAKRRLLGNFDLFLSDDRIRRFLPSLLGKHFYKEKRKPISVDLKAKLLGAKLNRVIQGTQLQITNKGCCYSIRVGHIGMNINEIVENAVAVAGVLAEKLPLKWKNVKILHLKTQSSVALPVYTSAFSNLKELEHSSDSRNVNQENSNKLKTKKKPLDKEIDNVSSDHGITSDSGNASADQPIPSDEEIPMLVPIQSPTGKKNKKKKTKVCKTPNKSEVEESQEAAESNDITQASKTPTKKLKAKENNQEPVASNQTPSQARKTPAKTPKAKENNQEPVASNQTPSQARKTPAKTPKAKENNQEPVASNQTPSQSRKTPAKTPKAKENNQDHVESEELITQASKTPKAKAKKQEPVASIQTPIQGRKTPARTPKVKKPEPVEKSQIMSTPQSVVKKRKASDVKIEDLAEKTNTEKKSTPLKLAKTEEQEQNSLTKDTILKKTPKKIAGKSTVKLSKSVKKAPQTPKLKQKKILKAPKSV